MKTLDDATRLRSRILGAFELADQAETPEERDAWLSFAVVGAGPTGVEIAGQIAVLAHRVLRGEYDNIDSRNARVLLVDTLPAVLPAFHPKLQQRAERDLRDLGVELRLATRAAGVDRDGIEVEGPGGPSRIDAKTVIWAAGVRASPLARVLADASGAAIDRAGARAVAPDLALPGHPEVFAIGDLAALPGVPGVAPAAIQEGAYVGGVVKARVAGRRAPAPFHYTDKGSLATIGRTRAVADIRGAPPGGLPRLPHLGPRPPRVPGRLEQPLRRGAALDVDARRAQPARAPRQRRRPARRSGRSSARELPARVGGRQADRARAVAGGDGRRLVGEEHALRRVAAARERPQRRRAVEAPVDARAAVAAQRARPLARVGAAVGARSASRCGGRACTVRRPGRRAREISRNDRTARRTDMSVTRPRGTTAASLPPFESVLAEHGRAVLRFCVSQVGPERAEDCFQETMLAALRALSRPARRLGRCARGCSRSRPARPSTRIAPAHARRSPIADLEPLAGGAGRAGCATTTSGATCARCPASSARPSRSATSATSRTARSPTSMGTTEAAARRNVFEGLRACGSSSRPDPTDTEATVTTTTAAPYRRSPRASTRSTGTTSKPSSTSAASRSPRPCCAAPSARRSPRSSTAAASARRSTWRATASARAAIATSTTRCPAPSPSCAASFYRHLAPVANALVGSCSAATPTTFPLEHERAARALPRGGPGAPDAADPALRRGRLERAAPGPLRRRLLPVPGR